jgi:hypothetical protein
MYFHFVVQFVVYFWWLVLANYGHNDIFKCIHFNISIFEFLGVFKRFVVCFMLQLDIGNGLL